MELSAIETEAQAIEACYRHQIPQHMHEAVVAYLIRREPVGGFLTAVLCNDLVLAASLADNMNKWCLFHWASLLYNHFPTDSYGGQHKVTAWLAGRRERVAVG